MSKRQFDYTAKLKFIKPYVNFDFKHPDKLGRKNKALITRVFNEINEIMTNYPVFSYVKSEKARAAGKAQFNNEYFTDKTSSHIKGIFLPPHTPKGTSIKMRGITPVLRSKFRDEEMFPFDADAFADDPDREIARTMRQAKKYDRFYINQGNRISDEYYTASTLLKRIQQLMNEYSGQAANSEPGQNHHFENWLFGIKGVTTRNQTRPKGGKRAKGNSNRRGNRPVRARRRS